MQLKHDWQVESRLLGGRKWEELQAETRCSRYHQMRDPGSAGCACEQPAERQRAIVKLYTHDLRTNLTYSLSAQAHELVPCEQHASSRG